MKINIKKSLDVTPALETYIEEKLMPLAKFIKHFDGASEAELWLEVSRTTNHHHKGEVFLAAINLSVPHKVLHAEESATDIRTAIDGVRDKLHTEIEKYKTKSLEHGTREK